MMTQRARVVLIAYLTFIGMLFGSLALETWRDAGRAEAQTLVAPADATLPSPLIDAGVVIDAPSSGSAIMTTAPAPAPVIEAQQLAESQWKLVEDYGPVWGGMLILFGIGVVFVKRNPGHWLARGHALTGGVGAVGLLGALLEANFSSASGAGVAVTLLAAIKLLLQKPAVPPAA